MKKYLEKKYNIDKKNERFVARYLYLGIIIAILISAICFVMLGNVHSTLIQTIPVPIQ